MFLRNLKLLTALLIAVSLVWYGAGSAQATTYYISPTGNDTTGTGSAASPWATLAKAAGSVPANQANVIHMTAGSYLMTSAVWIPTGTTLEGENTATDATKTVILSHQTGYPGYVVNVSTGNIETSPGGIRYITFDGDNYQGTGGADAQKISNFTVDHATFQHLNGPGLRLDWTGNGSVQPSGYETNNEVKYCTFLKNKGFAIGGEAWSSFNIHDNLIDYSDIPNASLSNPSPWGDGINVFWCGSTHIYNNTIYTPNYTSPYTFPQQLVADTITIFYASGGNEIDHNELAQWVTLVGSTTLNGYDRIMRIHDNHIFFTRDVAGPGIEIMYNDSEVYNNYIDNAEIGILTDPGAVAAGNHSSDVSNMRIHNNVFRRTNSGALYEGYGVAFRNSTNTTANNWSIYNNVFDGYDYGFQLDGGGYITNLNVKNNAFLNCGWIINWGSSDPITNSNFTNNIWHFLNGFSRNSAPNFAASNLVFANNLPGVMSGLSSASDAGFNLSGLLPTPYYAAASSGSLAVDGGTTSIAAGITLSGYSGNAPDIGAYEFGGSGTVTIPSAPSGLSATGGNAQATLSWTSSAGATSYNLYRGTSAGSENANAIATGIASTSYTDTGLTNGTIYYYKVAAVNSAGTSGLSNEAAASPTGSAAATPTFSPAGGTYTSSQSVTLSDSTVGAAIHYTTDGSTPTASSPTYSSPIAVSTTKTIKALATASGYTNSAVASATYTINTGGGTLIDRTNETGGTILARGDNAPNEDKTKAFDNNINTKWLDFSSTSWISYQFASNAAYVITEYKVTSGNDTASYPGRAPKSWILKGSNDGTTWTTLDTQTSAADTASLDTKVYDFANSTAYKIYKLDNIVSNGDPILQLSELRLLGPSGGVTPTAATPTFSPAGGTYTAAQSVTLSDSTAGAAIHYTTDGSSPTASSPTYSSPIAVSTTKTIKALATASGYTNSAVASATYTINTGGAGTPIYQINSGGSGVSPFAADTYASGGNVTSTTSTIVTAGVANAAPAAVYQSRRFGNFSYVFPSLTAGSTYTVRLHFAEILYNNANSHNFDVDINGATILSNFDIWTAAGNMMNKAVVETFTATADASGNITIYVHNGPNSGQLQGVEILH